MAGHAEQRESRSGRRLLVAYALLALVVVAVLILVLPIGSRLRPPKATAGIYRLEQPSACLGGPGTRVRLRQSGQFVGLDGGDGVSGRLRLRGARLHGRVTCRDGSDAGLLLQVGNGTTLTGEVAATGLTLTQVRDSLEVEAPASESRPQPSPEVTFGQLMLAIAAVILAARLLGELIAKLGQPRVMGEILAGILLGPTLLGGLAPGVTAFLFPDHVIPLLRAAADIGLAFYMFLVGLELDPRALRGRVEQAAFISHASIAVPMALGVAVALPLYGLLGPDKPFVAFAMFIGVAMSITAFPVLARILLERRMLKRAVGAMAMGAAAIDDVTAWALLALSTALAGSGSTLTVARVVALATLFCAVMAFVGRPLLRRVSAAYDEAGHVPSGWIATIFVGVLLSSWISARIGIAAIFGAFVMGLIMPRRADLTHDVTRRVEDFVVMVLLPLFFVVTGLRVQVGLLDRPELWLLAAALLIVAVAGKWLGGMGAARFTGFPWRQAGVIGALMNTRGLTELIVLNLGLELGVISPALFTMLVIMALVTTFMTGPALRLLDPRGTLSAPPEEELRAAAATTAEPTGQGAGPARAVLVAPQDDKNTNSLIVVAEPLARSEPPRELVLARLLIPSSRTTGVAAENRRLAETAADVERRRSVLMSQGLVARGVTFTSADPGADLVRLATEQEIDLVLLDGRRPLLGEGVPRGAVGTVLAHAPCDVAVLVEREAEDVPTIDAGHAVLVPFGGAEHDWAALELGAWIASFHRAPVRLLGSRGDPQEGKRDASRLLADASLVIQQLVGTPAEPLLIAPGRKGVIQAAAGAGLLVVGLSEQWREEGLGPVRSQIAREAPAPTLFVRRGVRPGALAPRDSMTRFTWSTSRAG